MSRLRWCGESALLCGVLLMALQPADSLRGDDQFPPTVRDALAASSRLGESLEVQWVRTRSTELPREVLSQRLNVQAPEIFATFFEPEEYHLMWRSGSCFLHGLRRTVSFDSMGRPDQKKPFGLLEYENSWHDGIFYTGSGTRVAKQTGSAPTLGIEPIEKVRKERTDQVIFEHDYLEHAGLWFPKTPADFGQPPQSLILKLLDQGMKVREVAEEQGEDRRSLAVLLEGTEGRRRFLLDAERGFAVVGIDFLNRAGELEKRVRCSDFQEMASLSVWLPRKCTVEHFTWKAASGKVHDEALFTEQNEVSDVSVSPIDPKRFVLNYNVPGALIGDSTLPDATDQPNGMLVYQVPADPEKLDQAIEAARKGHPSTLPLPADLNTTKRTSTGWWIIGVNVAAACGVLIWVVWRNRRGTR